MALLFWRKTKDTGSADESQNVEVNETYPLPVQLIQPDDNDYPPVRIPEDSGYQAPIAGRAFTRLYRVPGIGTGSAYADGDAFGTAFTLHDLMRPENPACWIVDVFLIDRDDEGLQVDVPIFIAPIASTTDNNAFAPTDIELLTWRRTFAITGFSNWSVNQGGQYEGSPQLIVGQGPHLYTQLVARGTINVAAGAEPYIGITVMPL